MWNNKGENEPGILFDHRSMSGPVRELGEFDNKVLVGTDEDPMLPSREGM